MFYSNAHTHSTWCDGKDSLEDMAQAAIELGFTDLGFTCHSPALFDPSCLGVQNEVSGIEVIRCRWCVIIMIRW